MEVFGLKISKVIESTEGSFINVDGQTININNYLEELDEEFNYISNNINSLLSFNAVATCNQIVINKDNLEQEHFRYVLEDDTRTLLISKNELNQFFIKQQ